MTVDRDKIILFDYTITKIIVNEQGIGTRQRVADQHVAITKATMDRLLNYLAQDHILTNQVNTNV